MSISTRSITRILTIFALFSLTACYNRFVDHEAGIEAAKEETKNVHANMTKKMKAQGLTVEKYQEILIKAMEASMSGRYGDDGSQAAMQWIHEQDLGLDSDIIKRIQQVIEASYNEFQAAQSSLIDKCRAYKASRQKFFWKGVADRHGFPTEDVEEWCTIVTSAETKADFGKGELSDIDLYGDKKANEAKPAN